MSDTQGPDMHESEAVSDESRGPSDWRAAVAGQQPHPAPQLPAQSAAAPATLRRSLFRV
jgi:hypothetical protein